jgi:hypothetical protein
MRYLNSLVSSSEKAVDFRISEDSLSHKNNHFAKAKHAESILK